MSGSEDREKCRKNETNTKNSVEASWTDRQSHKKNNSAKYSQTASAHFFTPFKVLPMQTHAQTNRAMQRFSQPAILVTVSTHTHMHTWHVAKRECVIIKDVQPVRPKYY